MSKSSEPRAEGWLLMRLEQLTARPHTAAEILAEISAAGWSLVPRRTRFDPEFEAAVSWRIGCAFQAQADGRGQADVMTEAYNAIVDEFEIRLQDRLAVVAKLRALPPAELEEAMAG